ncbi:MAG: NAD(P)-binding domain-containing protein [Actinomycetota bacterium]
MSRVLLFGAGATGSRIARQLRSSGVVDVLDVRDPNLERLERLVDDLGAGASAGVGREVTADHDVVVIATPPGTQVGLARRAVHAGVAAVTTSNQTSEVRRLLGLDDEARYHEVPLVVGAGFMPGLTCLLARHGAREFDEIEEIHVAKVGTGGPACARQHHRALSSTGIDWRDGRWMRRSGGSGRELAWFPDPVGGRDCYRAALPDALLLVREFERVQRVTARQAATRRDRLTAPLPMLRPPHAEGGIGAVRVELRGRVGVERAVSVYGAIERPAVAAGAVAAATTMHVLEGEFAPGARGLAGHGDTVGLLQTVASRGVKPVRFEGISTFI